MKDTIDQIFERNFPNVAKKMKLEIESGLVVELSEAINDEYISESDDEIRKFIALKAMYLQRKASLINDGEPLVKLLLYRIDNSENEQHLEDAEDELVDVLRNMPITKAEQMLSKIAKWENRRSKSRVSTVVLREWIDKSKTIEKLDQEPFPEVVQVDEVDEIFTKAKENIKRAFEQEFEGKGVKSFGFTDMFGFNRFTDMFALYCCSRPCKIQDEESILIVKGCKTGILYAIGASAKLYGKECKDPILLTIVKTIKLGGSLDDAKLTKLMSSRKPFQKGGEN